MGRISSFAPFGVRRRTGNKKEGRERIITFACDA